MNFKIQEGTGSERKTNFLHLFSDQDMVQFLKMVKEQYTHMQNNVHVHVFYNV